MFYEDGLKCGESPVKLIDGRVGLLIRFDESEAGVQIFGVSDIYWLPWLKLVDRGNCALEEI